MPMAQGFWHYLGTQLLSELFTWYVKKMATLQLSVLKEFWVIFRKEDIFGSFMCVRSSKFCNWASDIFLSQSSAEIFVSTLSEGTLAWEHSDALIAPFRQISLPPEYFRHFFVKTGGQASALDVWLPGSHR